MAGLTRFLSLFNPGPDERHGPLPALLLALTGVTGLVDAVSYLGLGHVFVANMTGNVIFLGFAVADAQDFSIPASLLALAGFLFGALSGGWLNLAAAHHRGRLLAIGVTLEILFFGAAFVIALLALDPTAAIIRYADIVLLALAMGLQNALARRLGVPDLTTTVLTLTLTGVAADSTLAGGKNPNFRRRLVAALTMLLGAAIGGLLVLHAGNAVALALCLALLVLIAIAAWRHFSSTAPWTVGS